ncbi:hypothetical protein Gotur_017164 [Gossypium turneri]
METGDQGRKDQGKPKGKEISGRPSSRKCFRKNLLECRNEEARLKARVAELEKSLHLYRSRNLMIELRASLGKIEELKGRIEDLEDTLAKL